jgi:hypothetical protein
MRDALAIVGGLVLTGIASCAVTYVVVRLLVARHERKQALLEQQRIERIQAAREHNAVRRLRLSDTLDRDTKDAIRSGRPVTIDLGEPRG